MELEILTTSEKNIGKIKVTDASQVSDIKKSISKVKPSLYPERQSLRLEVKGKSLKETDRVKDLGLTNGSKLYVKDLGPQIGWSTVFMAEYAGPLFVYLLFYIRPSLIYGTAASQQMSQVANVAAYCWSFHYAKRVFETVFVHRFSHATMPIGNLFKNCSYYWGFTAFVSYFVNHPLYTPPCTFQYYVGLGTFIFCELGNLSIHIALRNLRPPGTKVRRIPMPTVNPFTLLFNFVSCPNYTYEVGSWIGFTIMTCTFPAALFTFAGFYQMALWALGKHRNYKKEFPDYPKNRKSIIPFLL
ncbi:probable very-long-chain enoyl-CoA reductase art-1 [Adelges cooleyi]|uniref:probable very-long-chain enoyl-CoA reductase art-1 n=1 Tax=Adelges cooleyi TaxID=133065 RepID=UPI0021809B48|nr:probable very-long-chain enoyl-CoA reductase art-1 [Adelges cooleyi]XP_050424215.1 probable very-long-chain enoyl-CoA reductase art-1 [Adelges cooleyi]XP_050424216.1 probable very-long-chain enoyl-CoA reductase art-1 [Adelges cooleyi]